MAHVFLKRYPGHDDDNLEDDQEDEEAILEDEHEAPTVDEEPSREEAEAQGFYNVESILKHKYKKGWFFLTKWEGWPLSDATWEPIKAFVHTDGSLNTQFQRYCTDKCLERPLREAMRKIAMQERSMGPNPNL